MGYTMHQPLFLGQSEEKSSLHSGTNCTVSLRMKIFHQVALALTICTLISCEKPENKITEESTPAPKQHRAILYFDGDQKFQMDYEGTGYRQSSSQGDESVEFKAMHINHRTDKDIHNEKWVDASFRGTVVTSGEDSCNVKIILKVDNKVPFDIQTLGITPKGSEHSDDPVSHEFSPGQHELIIEGEVTGLYGKQ